MSPTSPTVRMPHAPYVSYLLNAQEGRFWRAPRVGESGFDVSDVAPRAQSLHGGPVTVIWTEGSRRGEKRPAGERRAAEAVKKQEMREFLEEQGYAVFSAPAGHLVLLTADGARETAAATPRADELLGTAPRYVRTRRSTLDERPQSHIVDRARAHAKLVLALRYPGLDATAENGHAVIAEPFSRTEYLPLGEAAGTGPYLVRLEQSDGGDVSRHQTLPDAQQAGENLARLWLTTAPDTWQWHPRDEDWWQGRDVCEWVLLAPVGRIVDGATQWGPLVGTAYTVYGPRAVPPRARPVVVEAPHTLSVGGVERVRGMSPERVRTHVSNACRRGLDMEQEPDGAVCIATARYEPQPGDAVPACPLVLPAVDGRLFDLHDDEGLQQRGVNPAVVLHRVLTADSLRGEGRGALWVDGLRYVPNPARRRITAARPGTLSLPREAMAARYAVWSGDKGGEEKGGGVMPGRLVRSVVSQLVRGSYRAVASAWVETDERGREVIYAKYIPSELPTRFVPEAGEEPTGGGPAHA
ncbi:hypothetical protein ABZW18_31570 [Streptomyces sp. NPDC004647]|uniref:hypothetical protein n=1 Tax=Streptomyces sp. NPDC004647 TaxID=3154671 RepID=UPI0033BD45A5